MTDILRTVLTMSLSGSIIAVLLFVLKPLVRNCLPKLAQYYLWLVVVGTLLVPVSLFVKLPLADGNAALAGTPGDVVQRYIITAEEELDRINTIDTAGYGFKNLDGEQALKQAQSPLSTAVTVLTLVYPLAALVVLLYYLITYYAFTRFHSRRNNEAPSHELAMLAGLCGNRRAPRLYRNSLASTPMMIGVFRPAIVLPCHEYSNGQLRVILLHELTHMRRRDVLVKWMSVLATVIHWFNPLVWIVQREINRACEFACDEAVIRSLDADGKQNYGETLLYVAADAKTSRAVLSVTMCEEKKALKERLGAIMKSKKHTRLIIIISAILIVVAGSAAAILSAGRAEALMLPDAYRILSVSMNQYNEYVPAGEVIITDEDEIAQIINSLSGSPKLWGMLGTSVNDYPVNDNYLVVEFTMRDGSGSRRLSLYTDGHDCIEEPYIGIYRAKQQLNYMYSMYSAYRFESASHTPEANPYSFETLSYPGSHALYVFELTDGTSRTVILSQPIRQGASGIWCVERMVDEHGAAHTNMTDTDYYAECQRRADEGVGFGEGVYEGGFFLHAEAAALRYLELNYEQVRHDIASALLLLYPSYELKGSIIHRATAKPDTIWFSEVEWLSSEDTERLNALNIDSQVLPNGFYVRETHAGPQVYGTGENVTVSIIDWYNNGQSYKAVSFSEFEALLGDENEYPRLWRLTFENGLVSKITEQYLP